MHRADLALMQGLGLIVAAPVGYRSVGRQEIRDSPIVEMARLQGYPDFNRTRTGEDRKGAEEVTVRSRYESKGLPSLNIG
jgi:hypothetical protein